MGSIPQKMAETQAKIILCIEDSQLAHMCNCDPELIWIGLRQVHNAQGLAMQLALCRKFLTLVSGHGCYVSLGWPGEGNGFSVEGYWC